MSSEINLISARYSDALFALAAEKNLHDTVKKDMLALQAAFAESEPLRSFLVNPIFTRDQAESIIASVLDALKASDLTKKFFALLARERRLAIAPAACQKYLELLAKSKNELTVEVTSAKALTKEQAASLSEALAKSTGKTITMKTSENAELIGGVQVRVGSKLMDNSVLGKLTRLRLALTKAA